MPSSVIYLDESGDLGWKFDAPYRKGGSSRFLTISALCVPTEKKHIPKRIIKDLHKEFNWTTNKERKWVDMGAGSRKRFSQLAKQMAESHPDIAMHAIVVKKQNVWEHIRKDGNKLYNYMIKLALLDKMATFDVVTLVPDPRSIKVQSGNSLSDYLQTELWFSKKATTNLITSPMDSKHCLGLQFADMLAGVIQARYEDNDSANHQLLSHKMTVGTLYF